MNCCTFSFALFSTSYDCRGVYSTFWCTAFCRVCNSVMLWSIPAASKKSDWKKYLFFCNLVLIFMSLLFGLIVFILLLVFSLTKTISSSFSSHGCSVPWGRKLCEELSPTEKQNLHFKWFFAQTETGVSNASTFRVWRIFGKINRFRSRCSKGGHL